MKKHTKKSLLKYRKDKEKEKEEKKLEIEKCNENFFETLFEEEQEKEGGISDLFLRTQMEFKGNSNNNIK